jgi:hypothetical protein
MRNKELSRQLQRIEGLINKTREMTNNSIELQMHWGRYLCILVAGFLENAISEIYIDFVNKRANSQVSKFTRSSLENISNPKAERFKQTAMAFDEEWGKELEKFFQERTEVKDAIDSIMNNRNQIAHGKNSSISVVQIQKYLNESVKAVEFIENQCLKKDDNYGK